jgi:glutamate/aspartate transport system substrate-binding protein
MGLVAAPAFAQELDTLKKIKASNTIVLGHRDVSVPFSYFDDKQQAVGYSIDLCMKIVNAIKTTQKLPKLEVKLRPVTAATRIPMIANGTVDIECGATTNKVERQQQVSFAMTTFVAGTRLAWKKNANFKTVNDLKGRRRSLPSRPIRELPATTEARNTIGHFFEGELKPILRLVRVHFLRKRSKLHAGLVIVRSSSWLLCSAGSSLF